MKFCPKCSASIADDATFCPVCGASLNENRCPHCGRPLGPGQTCPYCADTAHKSHGSSLDENSAPLTMWQYMGLILLSFVPLIGLIFMIVWACSSTGNIHLRNFARGALLVRAVGILLYILLIIFSFSAFTNIYSSFETFGNGLYANPPKGGQTLAAIAALLH